MLYDLDRNDPRLYLPDAALNRSGRSDGQFQRILRDKMLFTSIVGAHVRVPALLAIVARGRLVPAVPAPALSNVAALVDYCEGGAGVIVKPALGSRGRGVTSLRVVSSSVEINGRRSSVESATDLLGGLDGHIIVDRIEQADYAASIFPGAANTLRFITMQDPDDDHRPFIPVAVHRFGVRNTMPTDNWSRGGLDSKVDLASGRLGKAGRHPRFAAGDLDRHPETGARIEGVRIPGWPEVQAMILRLAETFSFLTLVGWDVIVTNDGPVVVEGNHAPDREIQKWHPFLADSRIRRYFEHRGVI
jgi:hypothetical protein